MTRIVIVGGGLTGCCTAYYLGLKGVGADVTVIEPDSSYEFAATPRAVGGVRCVFGNRENVEMSLYGHEVYGKFEELIDTAGDRISVGFRKQGYLFVVAGAGSVKALESLHEMQQAAGADVDLLDRNAMEANWPSFNFSDLDMGLYSEKAGTIDPHAALTGFRRAAIALGTKFLKDRVVDIDHDGKRVRNVVLESGDRLAVDLVVNAANCWAPDICAMVGMTVPIKPLRRQTFFFDCQTNIEPIPAIRDQSGFAVRPEGKGYLSGKTDFRQAGGFNWELDYNVFDEELWPRLAHRCQSFEAVKVKSGWVGHYDMSLLDGNPIIGPWVGGLSNFYIAAGFSGHGLQHGPAVGRGLAELLLEGRYETIDLAIFSYRRVLENCPILDLGPTA